jgi:hypothetical protein
MSWFWIGVATPFLVAMLLWVIWVLRGAPGGWGP